MTVGINPSGVDVRAAASVIDPSSWSTAVIDAVSSVLVPRPITTVYGNPVVGKSLVLQLLEQSGECVWKGCVPEDDAGAVSFQVAGTEFIAMPSP